MEIVLATHGFEGLGGSETYVLTVAEQLQRLGHGVTIHAVQGGAMSDFAQRRGLTVALDERGLPGAADAILVQDAAMAYALADRFPKAPQVFRACTELFDHQLPPNVPGIVSAVVVVSDRIARHIAALGVEQDIVRLRAPIDTARFSPLGDIRNQPRRAVLLGNYLSGRRGRMVVEAWASAGVECAVVGIHGSSSAEPEAALASADIVVGKARAILEGMACGRAAYVLDLAGGDGWVTPDIYPAMESDNFMGLATSWTLSSDRLLADLAEYRPEMGLVNRNLVVAHHSARDHARALVGIFRELRPRVAPVGAPLRELARLGRLAWVAQQETVTIRARFASSLEESGHIAARALDAEKRLGDAEKRQRDAEERLAELDRYARRLEADAADLRRQLSTRRVRAGLTLGRLVDRVRL